MAKDEKEKIRRLFVKINQMCDEAGLDEWERLDLILSCMKDLKGSKLTTEEREKLEEIQTFFQKLRKMH